MYKISYKDTLYNTGNRTNVLQQYRIYFKSLLLLSLIDVLIILFLINGNKPLQADFQVFLMVLLLCLVIHKITPALDASHESRCLVFLTKPLYIRSSHNPLVSLDSLLEWLSELRKATCSLFLIYHEGYKSGEMYKARYWGWLAAQNFHALHTGHPPRRMPSQPCCLWEGPLLKIN